jgi:hypothetical protein
MDKTSNTLETLLTKQQLKEYLSKEYPFNTNFLGQILKEKLEEDPDYEVWAPFFYCKYKPMCKDPNSPSVIYSPLMFISNKGGVCRLRKGEYLRNKLRKDADGYVMIDAIVTAENRYPARLHRALASVFIPVPPELKLFHPKDLQVNHIDAVKGNFELKNLEWVTDLGNKLHAFGNGLIKSGKELGLVIPVKGTVEEGPYAKHEFILHGCADYKKYGFIQSNIVACCKGRAKRHKNCSWRYATELEIVQLPQGLSEEIRTSLNTQVKYRYN